MVETTSRKERIAEFQRIGKEFKTLQKFLSVEGSFKSMQQATIYAGLAEVCEMLALQVKQRRE